METYDSYNYTPKGNGKVTFHNKSEIEEPKYTSVGHFGMFPIPSEPSFYIIDDVEKYHPILVKKVEYLMLHVKANNLIEAIDKVAYNKLDKHLVVPLLKDKHYILSSEAELNQARVRNR